MSNSAGVTDIPSQDMKYWKLILGVIIIYTFFLIKLEPFRMAVFELNVPKTIQK
jgi:hypothetical protein